jgi:pilus assembly protein CpaC
VQSGGLTVAPAAAQSFINISDGQRVGKVTIAVGQSETLRVSEPFENVVVGNPDIADVAPLTDQTLYLLGGAVGTTNLAIYNAERELIAVIDVEVTFDVSGMREALAAALPGQPIQIRSVGGRIMLQGAVLDAVMVDRAMQIAQDFAGEGVTNALTVASPQQVMLEVRIIEASRNLGRDLGVNWDVAGRRLPLLTLGTPSPAAFAFGSLLADFLAGGASVDVLIQALEDKGVARRLAEPNLTALSGSRRASMPAASSRCRSWEQRQSADEATSGALGRVQAVRRAAELHPDGARRRRHQPAIEPEVSELDFANAVRASRRAHPAASTTVELRDGQSMAMAGLLQTAFSRNAEPGPVARRPADPRRAVPQLRLPEERDRARRHRHAAAGQAGAAGHELATPLDNLAPSNDAELVLFGKLEVTKEHLHLIETGGNVRGPFGHMIDLPEAQRHVITK